MLQSTYIENRSNKEGSRGNQGSPSEGEIRKFWRWTGGGGGGNSRDQVRGNGGREYWKRQLERRTFGVR